MSNTRDELQNSRPMINPSDKNILFVGGSSHELENYKNLEHYSSDLNCYALNIDKTCEPSIVGSIETRGLLPNKAFDIIYFTGVPTDLIDMKKAFANSSLALKDDGLLLFKGGVDNTPINKNTMLTDDNKINITGLLENQDFHATKLRFMDNSFSQSEVMATKNSDFDLNSFSEKVPLVKSILARCTGIEFENLNDYLPEQKDEIRENLKKHLDEKIHENNPVELQKKNVLDAALKFLDNKILFGEFCNIIKANPLYNKGLFSKTEKLIDEVFQVCILNKQESLEKKAPPKDKKESCFNEHKQTMQSLRNNSESKDENLSSGIGKSPE